MLAQLLWPLSRKQRAAVSWFVFSTGHESLALIDCWRNACHLVRDRPGGI